MPRRDASGRLGRANLGAALRVSSFVAAAVLGVLAVWLIVTGTTQKTTTVGALLGFWAILMAAFPVFGSRHGVSVGPDPVTAGTGLARVRDDADAAALEERMHRLLRQEVQNALGSELAILRHDIAALRHELVEKVGGQLRLERIETTRLIGSDLEALQHEVRRLSGGHRDAELPGYATDRTTTTTTRAVVQSVEEHHGPEASRQTQPVAPVTDLPTAAAASPAAAPPPPAGAGPAPTRAPGPHPPHRQVPEPTPVPPLPAPAPDPEPAERTTVSQGTGTQGTGPEESGTQGTGQPGSPAAAAEDAVPPAPAAAANGHPRAAGAGRRAEDPFAGLPRLSPYTEFEVDVPAPSPRTDSYAGRRRTAADRDEPAGGRRRRDAPDSENVLARILERERSGH